MLQLQVPVEHHKMVAEFIDAMIALDYVRRNHADILPSYNKEKN